MQRNDGFFVGVREIALRVGDWLNQNKFITVCLILVAIYFIDRTPQEVKPATAPYAQAPQPVNDLQPAETTTADLHALMTTEQSQFYWQQFNSIMTSAPANKAQDRKTATVTLTQIASKPYMTGGKTLCRRFREQLTLSGQTSAHAGTACQQSPGIWCRQFEGGLMQCRDAKLSTVESLGADVDNAGSTLDRWKNNVDSWF